MESELRIAGYQVAVSQSSGSKSILFCQGLAGVLGGRSPAQEGSPFYIKV